MAQATITPARALARLMVAAFAAVLMFLVLIVGVVGIADPADSTGAGGTAPATATPAP